MNYKSPEIFQLHPIEFLNSYRFERTFWKSFFGNIGRGIGGDAIFTVDTDKTTILEQPYGMITLRLKA